MRQRIKQILLYGLLPLSAVLILALCILLYTTAGARFVLDKASLALTDVVGISATVKDGSIVKGLSLDNVNVNVPDIINVSADSLILETTGLYDVIAHGTYNVNNLVSRNLKVELLVKGGSEDESQDDTADEISSEIFILKFPLKIFINRLHVDDFAYLSDIVDVHIDMFEGRLRAFQSSAELIEGLGESVEVHLKNTDSDNNDSEADGDQNAEDTKDAEQAKDTKDVGDETSKKGNAVRGTDTNADTNVNKNTDKKTDEKSDADTKEGADTAASALKDNSSESKVDDTNSVSSKDDKKQKTESKDSSKTNQSTDTRIKDTKEQSLNADRAGAESLKSDKIKNSDKYRFSGRDGAIEKLYTVHLPLNAYISSLKVVNSRYYQDGFDTGYFDGELSGSFEDTLVKVRSLKLKHKLGDVNVKGTMRFENYYDLDFDLEGQGSDNDYTHDNYEGLLYALKGSGKVSGSLCDINLKAALLNPNKTTVDIRFNALSDDLALNADIASAAFAWPLLTDKPKAEGKALQLKSTGSLINGLDTTFEGIISGYGLKDFKSYLKAMINISDMDIKSLKLKGLYESSMIDASYAGKLSYGSKLGLDGDLVLNASDGSFVDKTFKGPVSIVSDLAAYLDESEYISSPVDIKNMQASVRLNGVDAMLRAIDIHGSFKDGINVGELSFLQKNNAVHIKGVVGQRADLQGSLNLYNLSLLHPSLSGDVAGTLAVTGAIDALDINLNARSYRIRYDDMSFDDINLNSFLKTSDMSFGLTGLVSSVRPGLNLEDLKQCVLDVHGSLSDHALNFICAGNNTLYLDYKGALDEKAQLYRGSIDELILNNIKGISLSLHEKTALEYSMSAQSGKIDGFELRGSVGTLNVAPTSFGSGLFSSKVDVRGLNLKYLGLFLPKNYDLKGTVNANAAFDIKDGKVKASGFVNADNTIFRAPSVFVPFNKLQLSFDGSDSSLGGQIDFDLRRKLGSGLVSVRVSDIQKSKKLSGSVDLDDLDLKLISQIGQVFNDIEGSVISKGTIAGSLDKPLFIGDIKVAGRAEPRYDIGQIEDFDLHLKSVGDRAAIDGFINLNGEKLNIDGSLDWQREAHGQMIFRAKNLPSFLAGYGAALADINIAASLHESLNVKGSVHIPKAQLTVKGLSSGSIGVSKDEILIGSHGTQALKPKSKAPLESAINLKVTLGDDVQLNAMGLNALVTGGVNVLKQKDSADFNGSGKISLKDGQIELYGHHFYVVKADTIFNGNITNPTLDVEVIANSDELEDDVEVGVKVTGSALEPDIELFSRPAMSQNEILSYILYGHGLEKSSATQDANNGALLLGLGLSSTTSLVNSIVGVLGVQDVQVGASGSGEEAQVSVQGYLTKKIRISYGYGIYNAVGEFKVRYELVRKLYAEFVSSVDQAVDLIYSFEFD